MTVEKHAMQKQRKRGLCGRKHLVNVRKREKLRDFAAVHTVVTGKQESATERTCVTRSTPA